MAKVCAICGKSKKAGNIVTFSKRALKRSWTPNLRKIRTYDENGTPRTERVCTSCIRSGKVRRYKPMDLTNIFGIEEESVETEVVEEE